MSAVLRRHAAELAEKYARVFGIGMDKVSVLHTETASGREIAVVECTDASMRLPRWTTTGWEVEDGR